MSAGVAAGFPVRANACSLAGTWSEDTPGSGSSTWDITAAGNATEHGLGNATGKATLSNNVLRIDWVSNEWSGYYQWTLASSCSGTGVLHFTTGPRNGETLTSTVRGPAPQPAPTPKQALVKALKLPDVPASNGSAQCQQTRGQLSRALVQARQLNDVIAKLTDLTAVKAKEDAAIVANLQKLIDQAAGLAEGWCNRATDGGYGALPLANGTPACTKARDHIVYVNGELKKAYANKQFFTLTGSVRREQLEARIAQLVADLERSFPAARRACAK